MMVEDRNIYAYFNVNFNVFFKLIKVNLLVNELYIYQNAQCSDKKIRFDLLTFPLKFQIVAFSLGLSRFATTYNS